VFKRILSGRFAPKVLLPVTLNSPSVRNQTLNRCAPSADETNCRVKIPYLETTDFLNLDVTDVPWAVNNVVHSLFAWCLHKNIFLERFQKLSLVSVSTTILLGE
jgi:hypothetical protein